MASSNLVGRIRNYPKPSGPALAISKVVVCIIPIAQIAIGAKYLHECPREHFIPIYLIVVGVFGLILSLLSCLPCAKESEEGTSNPLSKISIAWNSVTSVFLFCWFIAGNVWIYSIYQPNYIKNTTDVSSYCNKTLYLFAFWTTTLVYILVGLFFLCGSLVLMCSCLCCHANLNDDVV
ncbi:transmembrane protein 272-like [Pelmatolapia mariae]|uniref:transmembrane protein 272-like n=1 Tax=Pelmatolapia mariae TaxID=158779 RepID=UPI002FE605F2